MIETLLLVLFAVAALASGVTMLIARHPMRVALALIVAMLSLAAMYAILGVHVVAVFQVLIYVGAVMVFMVYVIMLLDVGDASFRAPFSRFVVPGAIGGAALLALLAYALGSGINAPAAGVAGAFGVQAFSAAFLNDYWLYFELISVLLIAVIVAAIAVVKLRPGQHG